MADGARKDDGELGANRAEEAALSARLRQLGQGLDRIGAGRDGGRGAGANRGPDGRSVDGSKIGRAMRLSAELVGGVIFGVGIGLLLDYALGISPWGVIVFLMLGFAGGVLTVMRSAGVFPQPGAQDREGRPKVED